MQHLSFSDCCVVAHGSVMEESVAVPASTKSVFSSAILRTGKRFPVSSSSDVLSPTYCKSFPHFHSCAFVFGPTRGKQENFILQAALRRGEKKIIGLTKKNQRYKNTTRIWGNPDKRRKASLPLTEITNSDAFLKVRVRVGRRDTCY